MAVTSTGRLVSLFALGVLFTPGVPRAQFIGTPGASRAASIEILKPVIRDSTILGDDSFASSAILLNLRLGLSARTAAILELPLAHFSYPRVTYVVPFDSVSNRIYSYGGAHTQLINPYVAIRWWKQDPSSGWSEFGVRFPVGLPSGADEAGAVGTLSEILRGSAFAPDVATFRLAMDRRFKRPRGALTLGLAQETWISTRGSGVAPIFSYRAGVEFDRDRPEFGLHLLGAVNVDPRDVGNLNQRMANQIEAKVGIWFGRWRPELKARVWLDQGVREHVPVVIGLALAWQDQAVAP